MQVARRRLSAVIYWMCEHATVCFCAILVTGKCGCDGYNISLIIVFQFCLVCI